MKKTIIFIALLMLIGLSADAGIVRLPSVEASGVSLIVAGGGTPAEEPGDTTLVGFDDLADLE